ncbi:uncharacterized protein LOC113514851 [Galleria mellonella]|uniref:Uncharacterized protein LOC113514851 n=1 Tax=Galleria mellonella TaxID=7137 RepID=A0ABM3ML92_GALME|nr:uncharacterized protein LOC113514851 [Galleria mellonella]
MLRTITLVGVFLVVVNGQLSTPVSTCNSNPGQPPINTYIENCVSLPCLLPQLQNVVLNIAFRAPRTIRSMRTLATAYLPLLAGLELPVPYDLEENSITCNFFTNTYCPVLQDEVVLYTLTMYIESFFPVGTAAAIEFRVIDESDNTPVFCLRVNIRITPPVGKAGNSTVIVEQLSSEH